MKQKLEEMISSLKSFRNEAFKNQNQELHTHLGRALANLIRAIELL